MSAMSYSGRAVWYRRVSLSTAERDCGGAEVMVLGYNCHMKTDRVTVSVNDERPTAVVIRRTFNGFACVVAADTLVLGSRTSVSLVDRQPAVKCLFSDRLEIARKPSCRHCLVHHAHNHSHLTALIDCKR